VFLHD